MLLWKPRLTVDLTILNGRSYTEQGGFPWRPSQRHNGHIFRLAEALDNAEVGVDLRSGALNPVEQPTVLNVLPGTVLLVEAEKMLVTSMSGATATVTRGYAGTSAVTHADGLDVTVFTTGDGVIDLTGIAWCSILMPAEWTAANIAFFACKTRCGTYVPMRDETGAALMVTGIATATSDEYTAPAKVCAGGPYMKLRSVAVGTDPTVAANQGADRTITFVGGE